MESEQEKEAEENIIEIQKEINKILTEEFEKVIEENSDNLLIGLMLEDSLSGNTIKDLIEKLGGESE